MAQIDTRAPFAPQPHQPKPHRQSTGGDAKPRGGDSSRGSPNNTKSSRGSRRSTGGGQGGPADRSGDTQGSSRRGRGGGQSGRGRRLDGAQPKESNGHPSNGQTLSRKQSQLLLVPDNTPVPADLAPIKRIVMSSFPLEDPSMMGVDNEIAP